MSLFLGAEKIPFGTYMAGGVLGTLPGVILATIFGANRVSLKSVIQKGRKRNENVEVTLVLITHKTKEYLIKDSIDKLYDLRTVKVVENLIRIEGFN